MCVLIRTLCDVLFFTVDKIQKVCALPWKKLSTPLIHWGLNSTLTTNIVYVTGDERLKRVQHVGGGVVETVAVVGHQVVGRIDVDAADQHHGIRVLGVRVDRVVCRLRVSPFTARIGFLRTTSQDDIRARDLRDGPGESPPTVVTPRRGRPRVRPTADRWSFRMRGYATSNREKRAPYDFR